MFIITCPGSGSDRFHRPKMSKRIVDCGTFFAAKRNLGLGGGAGGVGGYSGSGAFQSPERLLQFFFTSAALTSPATPIRMLPAAEHLGVKVDHVLARQRVDVSSVAAEARMMLAPQQLPVLAQRDLDRLSFSRRISSFKRFFCTPSFFLSKRGARTISAKIGRSLVRFWTRQESVTLPCSTPISEETVRGEVIERFIDLVGSVRARAGLGAAFFRSNTATPLFPSGSQIAPARTTARTVTSGRRFDSKTYTLHPVLERELFGMARRQRERRRLRLRFLDRMSASPHSRTGAQTHSAQAKTAAVRCISFLPPRPAS
jgi:hypothetical protein